MPSPLPARRVAARPATQEQRLAFLVEAGERLAASLNLEATVAAVGAAAIELADVAQVELAEPDGRLRRAWTGTADPSFDAVAAELMAKPAPATNGQHAPAADSPGRVVIPLVAQGRTIGALTLAAADASVTLDADVVELATAFARRAALALDAARQYRDAQAARARAEAAARWSDYLSEVSAVLAASMDYGRTLERIGELLVPTLADFCQIYIIDGDGPAESATGMLRRVASTCGDLERAALIHELERRAPLSLDGAQPQARVVRTGRPVVAKTIGDDEYRRIAEDDAHFDLLRRIGARSLLFVPLAVAGRTLGVLVVGRFEDRQPFVDDDLAFAEEMARRAALAVENARLYDGLRRERERAEEANRAKSDFLATMSHELRTPLSAIIGYGELLADGITGPVNQPQVLQLQRINASARHLLTLIEDILTFARLDAGRETPRLERVSAEAIVRDVASLVEPIVLTHGLRLVTEVADGLPEMLSDARRVRQILLNLLGNAVRYTERGEVRLDVRADGGDTLRFAVTDTGIGIAAEHREQIFEPFWQVQQSLTRRVGGTGLGLSVTRRLARLLGGDVAVTSEVGKGSTFTVVLPVTTPLSAGDAS